MHSRWTLLLVQAKNPTKETQTSFSARKSFPFLSFPFHFLLCKTPNCDCGAASAAGLPSMPAVTKLQRQDVRCMPCNSRRFRKEKTRKFRRKNNRSRKESFPVSPP